MVSPWDLYRRQPGFVLGFHGCDRSVGEEVLAGEKSLKSSVNDYDWLGSGIYFWEGNPERAKLFAEDAVKRNAKTTKGIIKTPFVVGAIIDLGFCCNLMDSSALAEVRLAYDYLSEISEVAGIKMPENLGGTGKPARYLDRAVIETLHKLREQQQLQAYDSVRSAFNEGGPLYTDAGFSKKAHIQISVINEACIRGYFRPILRN